MSWKEYGDIAFFAAAASSLVFVLVYAVLAPWYRSATGRNIMFVMATLAGAMCYFAVAIAFGVAPGIWPVRAILFTLLFSAITWRIVLLLRAQLGARREERLNQRRRL